MLKKNPETLPANDDDSDAWHVIVETPKGSCNKYSYDIELGSFKLPRVLPEGLTFPFDFGFIPSTRGEDGDPLDVLLLMDQPTFSGCLVEARLIGVIEAQQTEKDGTVERNDRLVAIPLKTRRYEKIRSVNDLDEAIFDEIATFFSTYNKQSGKKFKVLGFHGRKRAESLVATGMKAFRKKRKSGGEQRDRK